jgi:hypothetical protein
MFQDGFTDCSSESSTVLYDAATGKFNCGADAGAAGGGIATIEEGNSSAVTGALSLDFLANDFTVSADGGTEGDIAIDYVNSGITRKNQAESITSLWNFSRASSTQFSAGLAFFGGTATSSFASNGALTLAQALGLSSGGTATTTFYSGGVVFSDGTKLTQAASAGGLFWDNTNARLGIGTSSPYARLSVAGEVVAGSFTATSTSATSTFAGLNSGSIIPLADDAYDLGSPTNRFRDLYLSTASLHLESTAGETGAAKQWKFGIDTGNGQQTGTSTGFFRIQEGNSPMFYLNHAGQVGIGVTDPRSRLHVQGNAWLSGFSNGTISSSGTAVTGVGTSFLFGYNKISVGDQILANSQIRTVTSVLSNNSLTVDSAFIPALSGETYQTQQPIARFDNSNGDTKFIIGPGGNVGIGDLNPQGLLSVGAGDAFSVNMQGTVASGTWNGQPIGSAFGGTGINSASMTGIVLVNGGNWGVSTTLSVARGGTGSTSPSGFLFGPNNGTLAGTTTIAQNFIDSAIARVSQVISTIDGLSDVDTTGAVFGNILSFNGSSWIDTATSTLGINFADLIGSATDAQVANNLTVSGGTIDNTPIGAGTPSTGVFTNATSTNATTTNLKTTNLTLGITTNALAVDALGKVYGFATSTLATISGTLDLASQVGTSILSVANGGTGWANLTANTVLLGNGSGRVSTTTAGTNGQVLALVGGVPTWTATTTAGTGLTYTGSAFNVNATQNITALSNLTSNGFVTTSGGNGTLGVDTTAYTAQSRTLTVAGTANQLTSSAGAQDLSANRTWTLSLPNHVIFPSSFFATLASTTNATTTNFAITGITTNALAVDALGKVYGFATSTLATISGTLNLATQVTGDLPFANLTQIAGNSILGNISGTTGDVGAIATSSLYTGTNGQILARVNGTWVGVATTTAGTGLTYDGTSFNTNCVAITGSADLCDGNDASGGGGAGWAFDTDKIAFGTSTQSTTTALFLRSGLFASSTSYFTGLTATNATTTNLHITGLSTQALAVDALGKVYGFATSTLSTISGTLDLASQVGTSILSVANGGTGWANIFAGAIPYGNGTGALSTTTAGTAGNVLALLNGVPTWTATSTLATISGTLNLATQVTGDLPFANLTQGAANTVLANPTGATADFQAVATSTFFGIGTNGQILAQINGAIGWVATTTLSTISGALNLATQVTGDLPFANLTQIAGNSILGNISGTTGDVGAIATSSLYTGTNGQVLARVNGTWVGVATTTAGTGLTYTGTAFNVNTSQNIATLSNLTTDGVIYTSGANGTLNVDSGSLDVGRGGTGAISLTGLLQGNGTSAFTAISDSSTVGQILRVTGASTYAWGALDLSDTDAITGDLPFANITQLAANTVLANPTGATADAQAVATSSLYLGTSGQVLARVGSTWVGVATTTAGTGLTYTGSAFNVNTSQNIATLSNLTGNGIVFTSAGVGTLNTATFSANTIPYINGAGTSILYTATSTLNLALLTATDTTITFSGSYNGNTARTLGLNLGNANTWTALQQFSANASSTQFTATGSAYLATLGGKVGVGTTSPFAKLGVQATGGQTNPVFEVSSSSVATKFLSVAGDGIGTTTLSGLAVNGGATSTFANGIEVAAGGVRLNTVNCSTGAQLLQTDANGFVICGSDDGGSGGTPTGPEGALQFYSGGSFGGDANLVWDDANNRIGLGTSTPWATFSASSTSALPLAVLDQRGSGGLLTLQQAGTDRFTVANTGGLTINSASSNVVRTSSSDFASGTVGSGLENSNGQLEMSGGTVPNNETGTITTGSQPATSAAIGAGAMTLLRADGKYLVIRGGGTGLDIYDSVAGTFTNSGQVLTVAAGAGAMAFPRPGGQYHVLHGGNALTTTMIDPQGTFVAYAATASGVAINAGAVSALRSDGRYIFTNGALASTQIYDPVPGTFTPGPSFTTGTAAAGALALKTSTSSVLFIVGGASGNTQLYRETSGAANIGVFVAGPTMGTGCEINGLGSVAIKRADGKYVVLSKINASTVYDPVLNTFTCRTSNGPGTALGDGAHAIPIQDGRFLVIVGGGSQASYIYNPQSDTFSSAHGTQLTAITTGAHSILRHDGTWQILAGGGTVTNNYNTGLPMSGTATTYTTEDISTTALNLGSTLRWTADRQAQQSPGRNATSTLQFLVRTATDSGGCTTPLNNATDKEIAFSGDLIKPDPAHNCIRITVKMTRPFPERIADERGVFRGNNSTVTRLDYQGPALFELVVDNSAFLRRNNFDFVFPNAASTTPSSETSGPVLTRVEALSDRVYLPWGRLAPTTQVGTLGFYMGTTSAAHPTMPIAVGTSTMVIARPNKTFVVIASNLSPTANATLYDPNTQTFTAQSGSSIPTAANGVGGFALKLPTGKYLIVLGNNTTATNFYDPDTNTFTAGPSTSIAVNIGALAIPNADGTYTITHGGGTTTSSLFDPYRQTGGAMPAGPTLATANNCGAWAIPLRNGMYKMFQGVAYNAVGVTTNMNYDPRTKIFSAGASALTGNHGCGSFVIQQADGYWRSFAAGGLASGGASTLSSIINPDNGVTGVATAVTNAIAYGGGLMIPRADGTFLVAQASSTNSSTIIFPWGGVPVAGGLPGSVAAGPIFQPAAGGSARPIGWCRCHCLSTTGR